MPRERLHRPVAQRKKGPGPAATRPSRRHSEISPSCTARPSAHAKVPSPKLRDRPMGSVKCDDVDLGPPARHIGTNKTGTQKPQTWHRELQQCHFPHQLCHLLALHLSPLLCPTSATFRISYDYDCTYCLPLVHLFVWPRIAGGPPWYCTPPHALHQDEVRDT